jgi:hypothetical protein
MNQSDNIVERVHNKDEAEDANQHPPDLTSSPQSVLSFMLWDPKQAPGAEAACHYDVLLLQYQSETSRCCT